MTQITSMTGPVSSLRAQLRAQAEAALGTDANKSQFTERLGSAIYVYHPNPLFYQVRITIAESFHNLLMNLRILDYIHHLNESDI